MVKSIIGTSPPGGILEMAPARLITIHKRSFSGRSLDTIVEDTTASEKKSSSTSSSKQEIEQYVPQLANTVTTTKLSILHREGKEPMADRQQQVSGLSAELQRYAQTQ